MRRLAPFDLSAAVTKGKAAVEVLGRPEFRFLDQVEDSLDRIISGLQSPSPIYRRDALGNLDHLIAQLPSSIGQAKRRRPGCHYSSALSSVAAMAVSKGDDPPSLVKKVLRLFDNEREKAAVEEIRRAAVLASQGDLILFRELVRLTHIDSIFHLVKEGIGLG